MLFTWTVLQWSQKYIYILCNSFFFIVPSCSEGYNKHIFFIVLSSLDTWYFSLLYHQQHNSRVKCYTWPYNNLLFTLFNVANVLLCVWDPWMVCHQPRVWLDYCTAGRWSYHVLEHSPTFTLYYYHLVQYNILPREDFSSIEQYSVHRHSGYQVMFRYDLKVPPPLKNCRSRGILQDLECINSYHLQRITCRSGGTSQGSCTADTCTIGNVTQQKGIYVCLFIYLFICEAVVGSVSLPMIERLLVWAPGSYQIVTFRLAT